MSGSAVSIQSHIFAFCHIHVYNTLTDQSLEQPRQPEVLSQPTVYTVLFQFC